MLCGNCAKLAAVQAKKSCLRCQGAIFNNISVLCENCSANSSQCAICLKKVLTTTGRANRGCNCGKK